ncbi:type III-A CRISPR-associated RAMP protein Csm5 [Caloramator sp. E03]|uniref:type III-A CRISPR-associated RAMP protein Csm5 n=1 Tax=Caloramator sp. E03 TaxID=2576307 RepID=UPI001110EFE0|nr:type III-A CRISPR-associated RAMP protein Csm5 [Caloramator sp. E03]QCX34078.1 type III-A CRISPR-associated RAMP protein Csm5 [Caloramator sp. E03]
MNFKIYDAEIKILSPTTVTSGFDIGNFEVVFENNKIHVIDIMKMIKENKKAVGLIETFDFYNNKADFTRSLKECGIDYRKYIKYSIDAQNISYNRSSKVKEIIKTAGRPYIPGSSIKGALRSSLSRALNEESRYIESLNKKINEKKDYEAKHYGKKMDILKICDDIAEKELFKDSYYSPFRLLKIADTDTKEYEDLSISEIKILNICNDKVKWFKWGGNQDNINMGVSIHTETFKIGTKLNSRFSMGFIDYYKNNDIEQIETDCVLDFAEKIRKDMNDYIKCELDFYKKYGLEEIIKFYNNLLGMKLKENEFIIQLGFSTGYKPKSVIKNLDDDFIGKLINAGAKNIKGMFPKTRRLAVYNNKPTYPIGWIKVTLKERV